MKLSVSFVFAAALAAVNASAIVKRIDNRIPVTIPDGVTLDELCYEWTGACKVSVSSTLFARSDLV